LWIYPDSPKHLHYSETIISALMSILQQHLPKTYFNTSDFLACAFKLYKIGEN
jgi:hypothetical protein